ncbi:UNVERIFIED_ORG: hypothetical protein Xoosp15_28 [Xanthomonas phage Xoo-sp15]
MYKRVSYRWVYEVTYTMKDCPMLTRRLDDLFESEAIADWEAEKLKDELEGKYAVVKVSPRKLVVR